MKVYLTSISEDDEQIENFDEKRIKVTVTSYYTNGSKSKENPTVPMKSAVVRLKRLSISEILAYTNGSKRRNSTVSIENSLKRKPEIESGMMTRSKKQKISQEQGVPETIEFEKTDVSVISNGKQSVKEPVSTKNEGAKDKELTFVKSKRKSDIGAGMMTRSKKPKTLADTGLPPTTEIMDESSPNTSIERTKPVTSTNTISNPALEFKVGEVIWGKIRGSVHWPAIITGIIHGKRCQRFELLWFNNYLKTIVFRSQLFKFESNINEFSKMFPTTIGLETAAKEALIFLASKDNGPSSKKSINGIPVVLFPN